MTIHRKHRPQTFADIIGQDVIVTILQNSLGNNRTGQAYLFTGSRGTGKTSTARILARAFNCLNPIIKPGNSKINTVYEPCNKCEACLDALANRAPDLIEIDAASNRGIDDIRAIRDQVLFPPIHLKKKIYIIDEVHMLSNDAFNALLKTLEEPPDHVIFILATTELHKVPITIKSRCQTLNFLKASTDDVIKKLTIILKSEGIKSDPEALQIIARHADGAYRDAESILENILNQNNELNIDSINQLLGLVEQDKINTLSDFILNNNNENNTSLVIVRDILEHANIQILSTQLIDVFREKLFASKNIQEHQNLAKILEQLLEAYILCKSAPIPSLPLEIALLKVSSSGTTDPVRSLSPETTQQSVSTTKNSSIKPKEQVAAVQMINKEESSSVPVIEIIDKPEITTESDPTGSQTNNIRKAWREMCQLMPPFNNMLANTLKEAVIHSSNEIQINLLVRFKFDADMINKKKNLQEILRLLQEITGKVYSINITVNKDLPVREAKSNIAPPKVWEQTNGLTKLSDENITESINQVFELAS